MFIALPYEGEDVSLKGILIKLQQFLNGQLSFDNFETRTVTGETSTTVNTKKELRHGFNATPVIVLPITGNIYIHSITSNMVDIRSTQASVKFKALVIGGRQRD